MRFTEKSKTTLRMILMIVASAAVAGGAYALVEIGPYPASFAEGATEGAMISLPAALFELVFLQSPPGETLRRASFSILISVKTLVYVVIIVTALAVGRILFFEVFGRAVRADTDFVAGAGIAFIIALVLNFVLLMHRMLGRGVLANFVTGRYHRPREEQRVFLFLDLESSTTIAERIGDVAFLRLLDRFYRDVTGPIIEAKGQIYKYVGDEVIVTWPMKEGLKDARCLRCYFAIVDAMDLRRQRYQRDFGLVPGFRAGIHAGTVVTGEMGDFKQEIVHLGDTVNTAARIEQACKEHRRRVLASGDLLEHLELPRNVKAESLGMARLRGKQKELELFALHRDPRDAEARRTEVS